MKNNLQRLDALLADLDALSYGDETALDALVRRADMYVRKMYGEESTEIADLRAIQFFPLFTTPGGGDRPYIDAFQRGRAQLGNLIKTLREDQELDTNEVRSTESEANTSFSKSVFIVHGHDEEPKQAVARVLETLGMNPIILHEQPNKGRTIIEKFTDHSDVGFAIVLLTPDDLGRSKDGAEAPRARQNVIFELGFFLGKLGRDRVVALYRPADGFELPNDYSGVVYIQYGSNIAWNFQVAQELQAAGYDIDFNKLSRARR